MKKKKPDIPNEETLKYFKRQIVRNEEEIERLGKWNKELKTVVGIYWKEEYNK